MESHHTTPNHTIEGKMLIQNSIKYEFSFIKSSPITCRNFGVCCMARMLLYFHRLAKENLVSNNKGLILRYFKWKQTLNHNHNLKTLLSNL